MKTIYKSAEGREKLLALYDAQLARLPMPWRDRRVETSFGPAHLVETGNPEGLPLLVFHGGNSTTAYTLLTCGFLFESFHVYAVDTVGHPGKSAETCLSPRTDAYGRWGAEVISALGLGPIRCLGGSFGGGILAKTLCVAPELVERAALFVPSGIRNGPLWGSLGMLPPMAAYWATGREKWLTKTLSPMCAKPEDLDPDTLETARCSIDNAKIKAGMPSDIPAEAALRVRCPVLVMAGERDRLFPAKLVLPRAKRIFPRCTTVLMEGRGHMAQLTREQERIICDFLRQ